MYHCSAKCCENDRKTLTDVQRCIEQCSQGVSKAQAYLQNEIETFQVRKVFEVVLNSYLCLVMA